MKPAPVYSLNSELTSSQLRDAIHERIAQLQALTCMPHADDFLAFSENHLTNFFWLQTNLLNEIQELFTHFIKQGVPSC